MGIGDTLYFDWGINWDSGNNFGFNGNKGFDLLSNSNKIYNINNGNSSAITSDDQLNPISVANYDYGNTPMRVKLVCA